MSDTTIGTPKIRLTDPPHFADVAGTPTLDLTTSAYAAGSIAGVKTRGANALAPFIEIDRLYEAVPGTSSLLIMALDELRQVLDYLAEAQGSDNPMETDRWIQRVQLALPKLFAYRSIGDGFGVVVNSLHFAFGSLHGTPLTTRQLNVVVRVLRELRVRPAMTLEQGIKRVEELEADGLEVDPPDVAGLLEGTESGEDD